MVIPGARAIGIRVGHRSLLQVSEVALLDALRAGVDLVVEVESSMTERELSVELLMLGAHVTR